MTMPISVPALPVAPFTFDAATEQKLAALAVRDDRFAREAMLYMKPEHFTNAVDRNLVSLTQAFIEKWNSLPTPETLVAVIKDDRRINAAEYPIYIKRIVELNGVDLKEREFLRTKVVEFCRRQALLLTASSIPDLLGKPEGFDKIKGLFQGSFQIGEDTQNQFIDYFAEAAARKSRRDDLATGKIVPGVPTGIPEIDKHLYHKGLERKGLTVVMAPAKRGKTALMSQILYTSAVTHRTNCLDISLEVSEDIKGDRYDAALAGVNMDELIGGRDDVMARINGIAASAGKLFIERRPTNTLTTDGVGAIIDSYFTSKARLDMVCVDYLGIMRLRPADDRYVGLGNAAKELRRIAGEYNIAMLSAAQTNRDAVGKQVAAMDSIGESFAIVQDVDLLMSINANEAEMASGVRRIFFAASRNQAEVTIKVQGEMSKMQMIQKVLEVTL